MTNSFVNFLFEILEFTHKVAYAKGLVDARKKIEYTKRICKHGNFIIDGKCNCSTCRKGIDYQ